MCDVAIEDPTQIFRGKWLMDGATSIVEAAEMLEAFAIHLRLLDKQGAVLSGPIVNDHAYYRLPVRER